LFDASHRLRGAFYQEHPFVELVSYSKGRTVRWNTTEDYRRRHGQWKIVHTHWSLTKPQLVNPPAADM
jgi:hypothetical protein